MSSNKIAVDYWKQRVFDKLDSAFNENKTCTKFVLPISVADQVIAYLDMDGFWVKEEKRDLEAQQIQIEILWKYHSTSQH